MPRFTRSSLIDFAHAVLAAAGLPDVQARQAAEVLVAADARGLASHGLARLPRYLAGLEDGAIDPAAVLEVVHDTPLSCAIDAHGAMGTHAAQAGMSAALDKARAHGIGMATVRDSNHFGIACWYAMQALEHDMIGLVMTNTAALGVPTFGREAMFGTNPLAFAAPAGDERAFVLDMATTAVPRGKIEVRARQGQPLEAGWAVDARGATAVDGPALLDEMRRHAGGGLLPLGGLGTSHGGHKGYGLAVMVDILSGVLSAHGFGAQLRDSGASAGRMGHFFAAFRIDLFRPPEQFRADMDRMLAALRESPPAEGEERVYYSGLVESEREERAQIEGVPLEAGVVATLEGLAARFGVTLPSAREGGPRS
ncbi:Ldh family oxidoreductase [Halotalea alkalilenta]|uniref:Malate dehydrogenase n=1 Tax=Halotalea alkalilenta TaxID=376489 RepID=A0A172YDG2_9GAMM|nr:Ldh family oxidoreductase [Halotalea alkalilenta]ANF57025.1 malate dehydrogenase [Halotalea alkalilenta]